MSTTNDTAATPRIAPPDARPIRLAPIACPDCGSPMVLRSTEKFRHRDGSPRKFFSCSRWPECTSTHGAHPDGRPMGIPGDVATKRARMAAHAAFDRLWKSSEMTRDEAYEWIAGAMGMGREECHIGRFDEGQCGRLIAILKPMEERL